MTTDFESSPENEDEDHDDPQSHPEPGSAKKAPNPVRDREKRRSYISTRLEEITTSIRAIGDERKELNAGLKAGAKESGPDHKKLRDRRNYLAERLNVLRNEQEGLVAEKKEMVTAEPPGPDAAKKTEEP